MGESETQVRDLALAVREYCDLIEHSDAFRGDWLERLTCLLPRIHASVVALSSQVMGLAPPSFVPDYEMRFELFSRLHHRLGARDHYRLEYDLGGGASAMSGSLADDITDIYFELKRGLDLLEHDPDHPDRAALAWRGGFLWHWGQHLVDAERHLYELQVTRHLAAGCGGVN